MFCETCAGKGRLPTDRYNGWCMKCGGTGLDSDARRLRDSGMHMYHADNYMEGDNKVCVHCGQPQHAHPQMLA
jgi:hypothetical protein